MAMKYVRCIKIVHPLSEVRLYRMLSAYFRFIGIFACENITGQEYGDETDWIYEVKAGSEDTLVPLRQVFFDALSELSQVFMEEREEASVVLHRIARIFMEYDLMRGSYAISYFGDAKGTYIYDRMIKARERFSRALDELVKFEQERGEGALYNLYIWAAKSSCRRRMNELSTIIWNAIERGNYGDGKEKQERQEKIWRLPYFRKEELEGDIRKILAEDPNFYGIYAIYGFALELDDSTKIDSVTKLRKAAAIIGQKSYTSYLNYRIGRYCEVIRYDLPEKMEYYQLAYDADHGNYRALYKLAFFESRKTPKESLKRWEELLTILECRKDLPSLQPIECAYLYKTYRSLGNLYNEMGDWMKGIEFLEKAVEVYANNKNEEIERGFYPWMFEKEKVEELGKESWEIYKEAARDKLCIDDVYVSIIKIAALNNMRGVYDKYSGMRGEFHKKGAAFAG